MRIILQIKLMLLGILLIPLETISQQNTEEKQSNRLISLRCGDSLKVNVISEAGPDHFILGKKGEQVQLVKKSRVLSYLDSQGNTRLVNDKETMLSRLDQPKFLIPGYIAGASALTAGLFIRYNKIWKKGNDDENFSDYADYRVYKEIRDPFHPVYLGERGTREDFLDNARMAEIQSTIIGSLGLGLIGLALLSSNSEKFCNCKTSDKKLKKFFSNLDVTPASISLKNPWNFSLTYSF